MFFSTVPDNRFPCTKNETGDLVTASITLPDDLLPFQGHFPGNPILPGIAHISLVTEVLTRVFGSGVRLDHVRRIKFLAPVRPNMSLQISASLKRDEGFCFADVTITEAGKKLSVLKLCYSGVPV